MDQNSAKRVNSNDHSTDGGEKQENNLLLQVPPRIEMPKPWYPTPILEPVFPPAQRDPNYRMPTPPSPQMRMPEPDNFIVVSPPEDPNPVNSEYYIAEVPPQQQGCGQQRIWTAFDGSTTNAKNPHARQITCCGQRPLENAPRTAVWWAGATPQNSDAPQQHDYATYREDPYRRV